MSLLEQASLIVTPNAYKESILYSVVPSDGSGDMDVVRATTATRVNSDGLIEIVGLNIPRIDYTNGSCPSILVEPQRTNLLTYSEQFDNASWAKTGTTITTDSTVDLEGNLAQKLTVNTSSGEHLILKAGISFTSNTRMVSIFLKKAEIDVVEIAINYSSSTSNLRFNLTTKIFSFVGTDLVNIGYDDNYQNDWIRVWIGTNNSNGGIIRLRLINSLGQTSYLGNGVNGLYIGQSQAEESSNATSYIPTVASAVTRNADVISKTGISGLIGQTEGTMFFDGIVNNIQNAYSNILNTNKNLSLSTIQLSKLKSNNKFRFEQFLGNGTTSSMILNSTNAFANGTRTKIAIRYKSGSFAMYINGNLEATSSSSFTNIGTKTELFLNDAVTFFNYQESVSFNSVVLFTSGLTNEQLAQLTTL